LFAFSAFLLACSLLGMTPWPSTHHAQRIAAQQRWSARSFANYHITLQIERLSRVCFQELEVRGDHVRTLNDTCDLSWMSGLSISRMFELATWMEHSPDCYPSLRNCPCQRVRQGEIRYDPQLGYPSEIIWNRQVQPNVDHPDFWWRTWSDLALPQCNGQPRRVRILVHSLVPVD
jgi:hypothetical protein